MFLPGPQALTRALRRTSQGILRRTRPPRQTAPILLYRNKNTQLTPLGVLGRKFIIGHLSCLGRSSISRPWSSAHSRWNTCIASDVATRCYSVARFPQVSKWQFGIPRSCSTMSLMRHQPTTSSGRVSRNYARLRDRMGDRSYIAVL